MKRIFSILLALTMLALTSSVAFAEIKDAENFIKGNGEVVTPKYNFTTVRFAEDGSGNLVANDNGYETVSAATSKLYDSHFCAPRQVQTLYGDGRYRFWNGYAVEANNDNIDADFYESFDRVGEYVALNAFGTFTSGLKRIDLYLKSIAEVDFEVLVCQYDSKAGFVMKKVYEGKTQAFPVSNLVDCPTDENFACYYPIALEGSETVYCDENAPGEIVVKVKGYDGEGNPLPEGTLLPDGKKLQIAEMRISCNNAQDIMGVNFLTDSFALTDYYSYVSGSYYGDLPYNYVTSPWFVGYSVSGVEDAGAFNSNMYIYVGGNETSKGSVFCQTSFMTPASSWPVKGLGDSGVELYKVTKHYDSGRVYWIGDMGKMPQAISHIKVNAASGKATEVKVYSSNDISTEYNMSGYGNGAFANPYHYSWVERGSAKDENGVTDVHLYDNDEKARLWMIEVTEWEGDIALDPFNIYIRNEKELPEIIGDSDLNGTVEAGSEITYSLLGENLRDSAAVYFAIYEDGVLANVIIRELKAGADVANMLDTQTVSCTVPETLTGNLTARAFLWDKINLLPLAPVK